MAGVSGPCFFWKATRNAQAPILKRERARACCSPRCTLLLVYFLLSSMSRISDCKSLVCTTNVVTDYLFTVFYSVNSDTLTRQAYDPATRYDLPFTVFALFPCPRNPLPAPLQPAALQVGYAPKRQICQISSTVARRRPNPPTRTYHPYPQLPSRHPPSRRENSLDFLHGSGKVVGFRSLVVMTRR